MIAISLEEEVKNGLQFRFIVNDNDSPLYSKLFDIFLQLKIFSFCFTSKRIITDELIGHKQIVRNRHF